MAKKTTHVAFLLDQTGSMFGVKKDVIGGFNQLLKEQKANKKDTLKFSLTLFNSQEIEKRHVNEDIQKVKQLSDKNYTPNHLTPLLDATGRTIQAIGDKKNVLFIIYTDGYENYSKEFKKEDIRKMVKEKEGNGWKFLFLGADLDSFADAMGMGINLNINVAKAATAQAYSSTSGYVSQYRSGDKDPVWKKTQ
jgi:hypothetical protein